MAKDAGGSGASWYQGTLSAAQNANQNIVESRLFFTGTTGMSGGLDLSRSTDAREKGRVGLFGTAESYAGSYGRVTSESVGRDLNPLGRGDGMAYVAGELSLDQVAPRLPLSRPTIGFGYSVNNGCPDGGEGIVPCGDCAFMVREVCICAGQQCICDHIKVELDTLQCCATGMILDPYCHWLMCRWIACMHNYAVSDRSCCGGGNFCGKAWGTEQAWVKCKCDQVEWPGPPGGAGLPGPGGGGAGGGGGGGRGGGEEFPGRGQSLRKPRPGLHLDSDCSKLKVCGSPLASWLKVAFARACAQLLACKALPKEVSDCLKDLCSGIKGAIFHCVEDDSKSAATLVVPGKDNNPCDPKATSETTFRAKKLDSWCNKLTPQVFADELAHLVAHELLHHCDCERFKGRKNVTDTNCYPAGTTDASEGWAEYCTNACFGKVGAIEPYSLPSSNWTYYCGKCYC